MMTTAIAKSNAVGEVPHHYYFRIDSTWQVMVYKHVVGVVGQHCRSNILLHRRASFSYYSGMMEFVTTIYQHWLQYIGNEH